MNRTIISVEVQDNGDKDAIIVRGERNNQIILKELFLIKKRKSIHCDFIF